MLPFTSKLFAPSGAWSGPMACPCASGLDFRACHGKGEPVTSMRISAAEMMANVFELDAEELEYHLVGACRALIRCEARKNHFASLARKRARSLDQVKRLGAYRSALARAMVVLSEPTLERALARCLSVAEGDFDVWRKAMSPSWWRWMEDRVSAHLEWLAKFEASSKALWEDRPFARLATTASETAAPDLPAWASTVRPSKKIAELQGELAEARRERDDAASRIEPMKAELEKLRRECALAHSELHRLRPFARLAPDLPAWTSSAHPSKRIAELEERVSELQGELKKLRSPDIVRMRKLDWDAVHLDARAAKAEKEKFEAALKSTVAECRRLHILIERAGLDPNAVIRYHLCPNCRGVMYETETVCAICSYAPPEEPQ